MTRVYDIICDPYILCPPPADASDDLVEDFLLTLLNWYSLHNSPQVLFRLSTECCNAMLEEGLYPYPQYLNQVTQRFEAISSEMVNKAVGWIANQTCCIGDELGCTLEFDRAQTTVLPEQVTKRLQPKVSSAFISMLVLLSAAKELRNNTLLLASNVDGCCYDEDEDFQYIWVGSVVNDIEWEEQNHAVPKCPVRIEQQLRVITDPIETIRDVDVLSLWDRGANTEGARRAMELKVTHLKKSGLRPIHENRFVFGSRFLESYKKHELAKRDDYTNLLIETSARLILNEPKSAPKPFRVSEHSDVQRERDDGAKAWRARLTKKGIGLRLTT